MWLCSAPSKLCALEQGLDREIRLPLDRHPVPRGRYLVPSNAPTWSARLQAPDARPHGAVAPRMHGDRQDLLATVRQSSGKSLIPHSIFFGNTN